MPPYSANLSAALLSTLAAKDSQAALEATAALIDYARFSGAQLGELFAAGLAAAERGQDSLRLARAHQGLGHIAPAPGAVATHVTIPGSP